jgi:hypothetical protein
MEKTNDELLGSQIKAVLEKYGQVTLKELVSNFQRDCQCQGILNINNLSVSLQISVNDNKKEVDKFIVEYNNYKDDPDHE